MQGRSKWQAETKTFSVKQNKNHAFSFTSIGRITYLSLFQHVQGVVGNSSSGIVEAPSFRIGTIDIGDRQKGRVKAKNVINCKSDYKSIISAIKVLYSKKFQKNLSCINPYEQKNSVNRCLVILKKFLDKKISLKKNFYDIKLVK